MSEDTIRVPPIAKLLVGMATVGLIAWKLPIVELLIAFVYAVMIPLAFLAAIGIIPKSIHEMMVGQYNGWAGRLSESVRRQYREMSKEAA